MGGHDYRKGDRLEIFRLYLVLLTAAAVGYHGVTAEGRSLYFPVWPLTFRGTTTPISGCYPLERDHMSCHVSNGNRMVYVLT